MQITNLHVSNFKSFKDETITLGRLNILIGANAAGKSNLISILRFLDNIIDYGLENAISLAGGIAYVLNTTIANSEPLRISFSFSCQDEEWVRCIKRKPEENILLAGFDYSFEITPHKKGPGYKITKDIITFRYYQVTELSRTGSCKFDPKKEYTLSCNRRNGKIKISQENKTDYINERLDHGLDAYFVQSFLDDKDNRKELILHFIAIFMPPMFSSKNLVRIYDFDPKLMKKSSSLTSIKHLDAYGAGRR